MLIICIALMALNRGERLLGSFSGSGLLLYGVHAADETLIEEGLTVGQLGALWRIKT